MHILVLDDMAVRHKTFRQNLIGENVVHVYTADAAIQALENLEQFDIAYLDRDLDEQATMGNTPLEKTGEDVVWFIINALEWEKWPKKVVVHSWNTAAAIRMVERLRDAGIKTVREPFFDKSGGSY